MTPLTATQTRVLDEIDTFAAENGIAPTLQELCDLLGIRSKNGIVCHLKALRAKKFVTWRPGCARSIRTVAKRSSLPVIGIVGQEGRIRWKSRVAGRCDAALDSATTKKRSNHGSDDRDRLAGVAD